MIVRTITLLTLTLYDAFCCPPDIRKWLSDVQAFADSKVNIVLIGNKCDLVDAKVIDADAGRALAREFGIEFFEASAKTDFQVQEAFGGLANQVCERLVMGREQKKNTDLGDQGERVRFTVDRKGKTKCAC